MANTYARIKSMREDRDLKQKALSDYLGVARSTYASYELGERPIPVELVCLLADYYGTSVDYLLGRTNEKTPYPKP